MTPLPLDFYSKPDKFRNVSLYGLVLNLVHMQRQIRLIKKSNLTGTDQCIIPSGNTSRNKVWINKWILCKLINLTLSEQGWKCLLMSLDPRCFNFMTLSICFVLLALARLEAYQIFFVHRNQLGSSISVGSN